MPALWLAIFMQAQSTPVTPSLFVEHPETGEMGMWLPSEYARDLYRRADKVHLLEEKLQLLEQRDSLFLQQVEALQKAADVDTEMLMAVSASEQEARQEIGHLRAWYRSPILWFALGVVSAGTIAILVR